MVSAMTAIDGDGHILERQGDIRRYLDAPFKSRSTSLWPGSQPWDNWLSGKLTPPYGYNRRMTPEEQVTIWTRILDDHDIAHAVVFCTGAANAGKLQEPAFAAAVCRAANRHFAADFATSRIHPVGVLPMGDPQACAREIEYAVEQLGIDRFEILTDGLPFGLGDPFYDPIYETAQRCEATIAVHGSRSAAHEFGAAKLKTFAEVHCYAFPASMLLNFTSVMTQGVPVRFPELKMGFMEIGATWLPYYLDRLDEHWEKRGAEEMPHLRDKPSDLFRRSRIKVSVEGKETLLRQTIDFVGVEHLVYATDVPHWDGEFPENLDHLRQANTLTEGERRAILHDNAANLFSLKN